MKKTNLTLRISKEVLDKARELKINLSKITEASLKTETLVNDDKLITPQKLRESYRAVFIELSEILAEWGAYLTIGEGSEETEVIDNTGKKRFDTMDYLYLLSPRGNIEIYCSDIDETINTWRLNEDWPIKDIYDSEKIISNLIETLYRIANNNAKKLKNINLLKNILRKLKEKNQKEGEDGK